MIVSIMDDSPGCLINESLISVEQHVTVRARRDAVTLFLKSTPPKEKEKLCDRPMTGRLFPLSADKSRPSPFVSKILILCSFHINTKKKKCSERECSRKKNEQQKKHKSIRGNVFPPPETNVKNAAFPLHVSFLWFPSLFHFHTCTTLINF